MVKEILVLAHLAMSLQEATTISSDERVQLDVLRFFFGVVADLSAAHWTQLLQMFLQALHFLSPTRPVNAELAKIANARLFHLSKKMISVMNIWHQSLKFKLEPYPITHSKLTNEATIELLNKHTRLTEYNATACTNQTQLNHYLKHNSTTN